jgi:hypothetical protein
VGLTGLKKLACEVYPWQFCLGRRGNLLDEHREPGEVAPVWLPQQLCKRLSLERNRSWLQP